MKATFKKGQTMVEYIIIVCLIAVSLIAVFTYLSKAVGKKAAGATEAISETQGAKAQSAVDSIADPENPKAIKSIGE